MPYESNPDGHGYIYQIVFGSPVNSNVVIPLTIDPSNYGLPEAVVDAMIQEIVDLVSRAQNFIVLSAIKTTKEQAYISPNPVPEVLDPEVLEPQPEEPPAETPAVTE